MRHCGWMATLIALASCGSDSSLRPTAPFVPTGSVTGRLCDRSTGSWVGGAWVAVGELETVTDSDGLFAVVGLDPGEHRLRASDGGLFTTDRTVVVRSGETTDVGVERCELARGAIGGRICTPAAPGGLAGAEVRTDAGARTVTSLGCWSHYPTSSTRRQRRT